MRILGFDYPDDCHYYLEHDMWCREVARNRYRVGVSAFGVHVSGNFFYMCRPKPIGTRLAQGQTMGVVELSKTVITIKTPVSGTIVGQNGALEDKPELINEDPYGAGWIAEIEASDFAADLPALAHGAALAAQAEQRMRREPADWPLP